MEHDNKDKDKERALKHLIIGATEGDDSTKMLIAAFKRGLTGKRTWSYCS